MNYNKILSGVPQNQLLFKGVVIDIKNMSKLKDNDGLIENVNEWIINDDLYAFSNENGFMNYHILITLCNMIQCGELEIAPTDKCSEKNVEYIKKLMSGLNN